MSNREKFLHIEFCGQIPNGHGISFLSAEVPKDPNVPFAMVQFAIDGRVKKDMLRLDCDKRIFLDSPTEVAAGCGEALSPAQDYFIRESAPKIVEFLNKKLHPEDHIIKLEKARLKTKERIREIEQEMQEKTCFLQSQLKSCHNTLDSLDREIERLLNPEAIDSDDFEPW